MPIDPKQEFEEYKKFAFNRNMVGVAIGLILATAFQKTASGISDYLIMPIINYIIIGTGEDWRLWSVEPIRNLKIEIGKVIGIFIDFLILSSVLYVIHAKIIKQIWPDLPTTSNQNSKKNDEGKYLT